MISDRGALALALLVSGCTSPSFYRVETALVYGEREDASPSVVSGRSTSPGAVSKRVAVQWPSYCANETSATSQGDAESRGAIATIDCSVEIAALERTFARAGYEVVLWDAVRRHAAVHEQTPEESARQFRVPLLVRINSFERSAALPGADARWAREYYASDRSGVRGTSATVAPEVAGQLDSLAAELEGTLDRSARLAITLDASVENVATGEVLWFYRWTHIDDAAEQIAGEVLVMCMRSQCRRVEMLLPTETVRPGPRSGSTEALSVQGEDADERRARYHALSRVVLDDFVGRFEQARGSWRGPAASAPAPAPPRPTPRPAPRPAPPAPSPPETPQ